MAELMRCQVREAAATWPAERREEEEEEEEEEGEEGIGMRSTSACVALSSA